MRDTIARTLDQIEATLSWIPSPVIGAAILALAVAVALALHKSVVRLLRRLMQARSPYLMSLYAAAGAVTRFALILVGLSLALPFAPFGPDTTGIIARFLLLATIALLGW